MTEQVWYYARGDVEKGPMTGPQIKALAAAGKIRQDDFVWKEGMENWAPAGEVKELFPSERVSDTPLGGTTLKPAKKKPASRAKIVSALAEARETGPLVRPIGHTSLVVGLLVVLLARGCDTLGARHVERLQAIAVAHENNFQQDGQRRLDPLELRQRALQQGTPPSAAEQRELNDLNSQLARLESELADEREQLEATVWRAQWAAARQAETEHLRWGIWRETAFVLGTVVLAIGLLAVVFTSEGPERWIYLAMLAAIVFGIYVGGSAFTP